MPPWRGQALSPEMQAVLDAIRAPYAGKFPVQTGHQDPATGQWIGPINWGAGPARLKAALMAGRGRPGRGGGGLGPDTGEASGWHVRYRAWMSGRGPHPGAHPITGQMYLDPSHAPAAAPAPAPDPVPVQPGPPAAPPGGTYFPPGPPLPGEMYPTPAPTPIGPITGPGFQGPYPPASPVGGYTVAPGPSAVAPYTSQPISPVAAPGIVGYGAQAYGANPPVDNYPTGLPPVVGSTIGTTPGTAGPSAGIPGPTYIPPPPGSQPGKIPGPTHITGGEDYFLGGPKRNTGGSSYLDYLMGK